MERAADAVCALALFDPPVTGCEAGMLATIGDEFTAGLLSLLGTSLEEGIMGGFVLFAMLY